MQTKSKGEPELLTAVITSVVLTIGLYYSVNQDTLLRYLFSERTRFHFFVNFLLNFAVVLSFVSIIQIYFRKIKYALLFLLSLYIPIFSASYLKSLYLGTTLSPKDFVAVFHNYKLLINYLSPLAILGLFISIALSAFLIFKGRKKFDLGTVRFKVFFKRSICIFPGLYVLFAIYFSPILPFPAHLAPEEFFAKMYYTPKSYSYWGPVVCFFMEMKKQQQQYVLAPEYSQENFNQLVKKYMPKKEDRGVRPDIIVLLVESMMDLNDLPGLKLSRDPLANLRAASSAESSGKVFVPAFGGGTANTEFDLLTGSNLFFFPHGTVPYLDYVNKSISSFASRLRDQGFETTAMHNFKRGFYRRSEVYPLLGFNQFMSSETMRQGEQSSMWPDDTLLASTFLGHVKKMSSSPQFLFLVTVGTHGPYAVDAQKDPIQVQANVSKDAKAEISDYSTRLEKTDQEIAPIIDYAKNANRPTILIIFGDHLPALYPPSPVFEQLHFVHSVANTENKEDFLKLHLTPYSVISNMAHDPLPKEIGINCLLPLVTEKFHLPHYTAHDEFMVSYCSQRPIEDYGRGPGGWNPKDSLTTEYRMFSHDFLFGQSYAQWPGSQIDKPQNI